MIYQDFFYKGRRVKKSTEHDDDIQTMEGLTEQDRQVCLSIVTENYFDSYYADVEYRIDEDRTLSALVGHPLVFLEGDLEHPVELVDGAEAQAIRDTALENQKHEGVIKACPTLANLEAVDGEYLVGDLLFG